MQPKFTQRSLVFFAKRLSLLLMLIVSLTLVSIGQTQRISAEKNARLQEKMRIEQFGKQATARPISAASTNDAGLPAPQPQTNAQPDAVCATFTGSLASGDATMSPRLFRGGTNLSSCSANPAFPGTSGADTYFYDTYTWTNTSGLTQCATFTLNTTDVTNANIQHGIWNGSFNAASLATNYISDPGSSSGTPIAAPLVINATITAGQTVVIAVWSANGSGTAAGTASNYTVTVDLPLCSSAACTGTPAPGNTLSTVSTVCPGTNFTLSLQNTTSGSGVTYQWQTGPSASGPWTNAGPNSPTWSTNQTVATYYRCNVTCTSNTGTSTPVGVAITPPSGCYCIPGASDCTDDDMIIRVRISTLDNASDCSAGPPAGYSNYTSTVAAPTVYSGAINPITVDVPTSWTEQVAVWIDYNQNGQFETTEFTNIGNNAAGGTITNNIVIPSSALSGVTRMRVRVRFSTAWTNGLACTTASFGETEDYNVNIQPCVPVTVTSSPSSASIVCGAATSFTVATTGTLPAYSWEWRPNASSAWFAVTNGGIYSGATTSTLTLTNVSAAYSGYQYRAVVVGGCSATDVSQAATLTVNPLVPVVNPASATICTGTVQQLSLTNSVSAPVTSTFTSGTVSISIPESPGGTSSGTSSITVSGIPAGAVITDMKVKLNMTHAWVGDVCYVVKAPNGKVLNLDYFLSQTGGGGTNFVNTVISSSGTAALNTGTSPGFTGTFKPDAGTGSIIPAAVAGPVGYIPDVTTFPALYSTPNGTWTLAFYDYYVDPDPGTFTKWDLEITYVAPTLAQGIWSGTAGTMFTDAAATVPYTGTPATTIYVKPTTTTNYSVYYTTTTPCTSATTIVPVNVSIPATGLAVTPSTRAVCLGGNTTFAASVTAGTPLAYQWQVSADGGLTYTNISGATSSTLTISGVTNTMNGYRYRFVVTSAPCAAVTSTSFGTLTINPLPVASLTATDLTITPGQTSTITASSNPAASTYSWIYNGTALSTTGNSVTAGIDQLGTYTVTATTAAGCVSSAPATITIGAEASDRLWIYPNPNQGAFQVRLYYVGTPTEKRVVNLYNSAGQIVASKEFDMTNTTSQYLRMDFDLGADAKGTYVVKVIDKYTGRIVSGLVVIQ